MCLICPRLTEQVRHVYPGHVEVDHDAAEPPYLQVAAILRDRIRSDDLPPGARVPSISYLMQEYGIARNTARRAIGVLADEGLITVRQGWGTFVKPQP
jgi:DNA-binding GntR family transcriptional regulator